MEAFLSGIDLLWVDLQAEEGRSGFFEDLQQSLHVHRIRNACELEQEIKNKLPRLVCFDFDYPTVEQLELLKQTKLNHPSVPIVMLTEQHSEELVLWALRTRVWDYFVKPVNRPDFKRRLHDLSRLMDTARLQGPNRSGRTMHMPEQTVPIQVESLGPDVAISSTTPAVDHISEHYSEKIPLRKVADLCGMGPYQFSRAFKRDHGLTFREYLIRYRITKALELFKQADISIIDIVFAVGFNDPSHFTRTFKQYVGVTPSVYRSTLRSRTSSETKPEPRIPS